MAFDIARLIRPRSIALIGAGAWTDAVAAGNAVVGFPGTLYRVHPTRPSSGSTTYYRSVAELPEAPDSAFLAVPNHEVPGVAQALASRSAGGFVCFSSGFSEVAGEQGLALTRALEQSAGALPYFGPNCYGFVNFFDAVAMMPDQIVGSRQTRGVALICQSGTIALTLMYNRRSLPVGYVFSVGNQTRLAVEDLIDLLCDDERVTAFGLYLEGVKDPARFARATERARAAGKPIALIKAGRTAAAARTAHTHTGAMTGADAVFDTFCRQAGIARCDTLGALCETLKIFHTRGPLKGNRVLIMGASGGDMAMSSDVSRDLDLEFSPFTAAKTQALHALLGQRVTVANPLDVHTYLWFDPPALRRVFGEVLNAGYDAAGFMLDCPPEGEADSSSFDAVIDEYLDAARGVDTSVALIGSLPETVGLKVRQRCLAGGVAPLQGLREALEALAHASRVGRRWQQPGGVALQRPRAAAGTPRSLSEFEGKQLLARHGVAVPRGRLVSPAQAPAAAAEIGFPVVLKVSAATLAHKTEAGGVALHLTDAAAVQAAATRLARLSEQLLVEEMVLDAVAEVLVGVVVDPQFGQVLVLGSGGIYTELLADSVSLLPPWDDAALRDAIATLRVSRLLSGYRGKPAGDLDALLGVVRGVARFAAAQVDQLSELDLNPVIVRPRGRGALAVDAVVRLTQHLNGEHS